MGVYDRQVATALRMIAAKGAACTWIKHEAAVSNTQPWKNSAVLDPDNGNQPKPEPTFPVRIVILTPKQDISNELFHLQQGSDVPIGGPFGLMGQVPFTPQTDDKVVTPTGKNYVIKSIDLVAPNDVEEILWKIQFK